MSHMKPTIQLALMLATATSLLSGCAFPGGTQYKNAIQTGELAAPKTKGLVLIYDGGLPWGKNYQVYANDVLITDALGTGTFYPYYATPGPLGLASTANSGNFWVDAGKQGILFAALGEKKELLVLNIVAGETYYVKMSSGWVRERMQWVPKETGEDDIQSRHWVNPQTETNP